MPTFKKGSAIYRPDLGAAVMEYYEEDMQGYVGLEVMPLFRTALSSSSYPVIPKEALLKIGDTARAPRSGYSRDDYEMERGYFTVGEYGREEFLDDVERALLDQESPGLAELVATKRAYQVIMRSQEKRIADLMNNASNFATNNVAVKWNAYTTADPLGDVMDAKLAFRNQCGMRPNALLMTEKVKENVKRCSKMIDQIKYTFPGIDIAGITAAQLAQFFDVPRVIIADGIYDSAPKGVATSIASIWSNDKAWLIRTNGSLDILEPCVGRTFLWTADSPTNPVVEQYREDPKRSDVFRVRHNTSESLIASRDTDGTIVSNISASVCYVLSDLE